MKSVGAIVSLVLYIIKELIILTKTLAWIAVKWLQSDARRLFLKLRYNVYVGWRKKKPIAEVYLSLNDPYSYMLVQVLPLLSQRFNVEFKLLLLNDNIPGMAANVKLWRTWALKDANNLAKQYGLNLIEKMPTSEALQTGQQVWQLKKKSLENAMQIFQQTWFDEFEDYYHFSTPVITHQIKNQMRQTAKGHYMPATIYFFGDWYWGLDRLDHFEQRLITLNLAKQSPAEAYFQRNTLKLTASTQPHAQEHSPIEVFVSIRSPYSYLGFKQAQMLSQHYQIPLAIKPVLPMLMRGLPLPEIKQRYIFSDAVREAKSLGIPFHHFTDPLGDGVMNSYRLFSYAEHKNKAEAYIQAIFEAVYVKNIDLAHQVNVERICQQLELDYVEALKYADEHDWQSWADENQQEVTNMNFWGVPCFRYKNTAVWGQDRLWLIENEFVGEA